MKSYFELNATGVLLIFLLSTQIAVADDVIIEVQGIRKAEGNVVVSLFDSENSYRAATNGGGDAYSFLRIKATGRKLKVTLNDFPAGDYAAIVYHDQNANDKFDSDFFGTPTEGFGFSDAGHSLEPSYQQARVQHRADKNSHMALTLIYLDDAEL